MATTKEMTGAGDSTVIGPSILISGKLSGDEDLTVRGRVEGELNLTRTLIVETTGVVKADVAVRNAVVSGVVVGNITATESVELTRDGRMVGDIRSPRVIIVDGASFRGRVDMGSAEPGTRAERTARPAPAPARAQPAGRMIAPPRPPAPPLRGEARARTEVKPTPPPPPAKGPSVAPKPPPSPVTAKPQPPAAPKSPPTPPSVAAAAGAKKKVVVRKKGR
jgi:cytoskeletal protein CcmA (bactofilin family)